VQLVREGEGEGLGEMLIGEGEGCGDVLFRAGEGLGDVMLGEGEGFGDDSAGEGDAAMHAVSRGDSAAAAIARVKLWIQPPGPQYIPLTTLQVSRPQGLQLDIRNTCLSCQCWRIE
jgi:hypothetical protein